MKNKKYYIILYTLTKSLFAVGIGSLAIATLLILISLNIYQQSVAEHIENERCFQDPKTFGWCRITFEKELEEYSIVSAIFGAGLVAIGVIAFIWKRGGSNRTTTWKQLLAIAFSLVVCYGLYNYIFSTLEGFWPQPFYFLRA